MIDFDKAVAFHGGVLRGLAARQRVTAHNIANQSTANFRSSQVRFEETLGRAMRQGRQLDGIEFRPEKVGTLPVKINGNDVDLEREWVVMESDRLLHELVTRATGGVFRGLLGAIRSR